MMKKFLIASVCVLAVATAFTQNNNEAGGFKRENVFIGGSLNVGLYTGYFAIGGTPEVGYSFNEWLDGGLAFNINYTSQKSLDIYNDPIAKYSAFNYGAGAFFRVYPIENFFLQGQLENNFITYKTTDLQYDITGKNTVNATSFLAGIGYGQRQIGQGSFYTVLLIDLLRDVNSPYRLTNYTGTASTVIPILRGGFTFYLKPKKRK